jgi:hypothetical protein
MTIPDPEGDHHGPNWPWRIFLAASTTGALTAASAEWPHADPPIAIGLTGLLAWIAWWKR